MSQQVYRLAALPRTWLDPRISAVEHDLAYPADRASVVSAHQPMMNDALGCARPHIQTSPYAATSATVRDRSRGGALVDPWDVAEVAGSLVLLSKRARLRAQWSKHPEAMRVINFPELYFDAVIGIAVSGQDSAARSGQLQGDDANIAQSQPSGVSDQPILQPDFVIAEIP